MKKTYEIHKCDRCGKELGRTFYTGILLYPFSFWHMVIANHAMELCPECKLEFKKFMGEMK